MRHITRTEHAMTTRAPFRPRICPWLSWNTRRTRTGRRHPTRRQVTSRQRAAVQAVMRLFVEEDLAQGVSPHQLLDCAACRRPRPMPGFIRYGRHLLCNECATEYEIARLRGQTRCADEFVRRRAAGRSEG
ncbi:MAG: hypothetical protein C4290_00230 [Chloroflexota bacterium]